MHQRLLVILILSLTTSTARGQTPPAPDQTETAKALLERIERLEKRVAELEAKQAAAPVAAVATSNVSTAQKAEPEAGAAKAEPTHPMETRVDQAAVGQVETHYPSLQFRGRCTAEAVRTHATHSRHGAAVSGSRRLLDIPALGRDAYLSSRRHEPAAGPGSAPPIPRLFGATRLHARPRGTGRPRGGAHSGSCARGRAVRRAQLCQ